MQLPLSEQEILRQKKVDKLRSLGINPYPSASFFANTTVAKTISIYQEDSTKKQEVILAGRIMSRRIMGAASFIEIQDHTGKVQLYIHRDSLCPGENKTFYNEIFKKLLDIGDIVGIQGYTFTTKTGVLAIHTTTLKLLSKAIKPLPSVKEVKSAANKNETFYSFSDPDQRYRQRYVDLILNQHVRDTFQKRTKLIKSIRKQFDEAGYLEVETPILQPLYGGAHARPFKTHHNTLDMPLYLRIANELYLKRLIVGGFPGVYEFAKNFRNEGMSRFHNPEFTVVELYVAYRDYQWMMSFVENLIKQVALDIHRTTQVQVGEHVIDFGKPWQRFTILGAIKHYTGVDIAHMNKQELRLLAHKLHVAVDKKADRVKIIDALFGHVCEPKMIQPTFITDYPIEISPLAKQHHDNPELVERFEVICNGKEICNAFSELNDPVEQRKRFESQHRLAIQGDQEAMLLDEDFLRSLSYGMAPTAGIGIGIDRLAMIMTNQSSIQEVILFPQMRKEKKI
ncbi:MAG: lysine--tRNA ligase [Bacteroidota bacterium]